MLIEKEPNARSPRRERRLLQDESRYPESLGCPTCPQRTFCGGLKIGVGSVSCLDFCCGGKASCDIVCPNRPESYVDSVREINGFGLTNVPRAAALNILPLPSLVPIFYHGNARAGVYAGPVVCLPFFRVLGADGWPKFQSESALRSRFRISASARLILSGTAKDRSIETWWNLNPARQLEIIKALRDLGVALVTTPNYSLFTDSPRWDDMHSMKRIALVWSEFQNAAMPAALHVNSRTERDVERWAEFIGERPEVTSLAFEFGTGAGRGERRALHAKRLVDIAAHVGRPLRLLVRGAADQISVLRRGFDSVTLLDTTAFMRTMYRLRAERAGNGSLSWVSTPTLHGEPLDHHLGHNIAMMRSAVG